MFSCQSGVGYHIARKWILTIHADGAADWAHETYTDDPSDDHDDNWIQMSGRSRAEWADESISDTSSGLQITIGDTTFHAECTLSDYILITVVEGTTSSGNTSFACTDRQLQLREQQEPTG